LIHLYFNRTELGYNIIELGASYRTIREKLAVASNRTSVRIAGFGDMSAEEIEKDSGLPLYLSQLAKKREYSEPFKILEGNIEEFLNAIRSEGLCCTQGGRYLHALGTCDKGKAVSILKNLYLIEFKKIISIGVGDSTNDLTMLKIVDKPFFVDKTTSRKAVWREIELIAQT
jgi:mannosyl-3-phosphoglycerate phosphatase family protein